MTPFESLHALSENAQIQRVGEKASGGMTVGFIVKNKAAVIERFEAGLRARFPELRVERIGPLKHNTFAMKASRVQN